MKIPTLISTSVLGLSLLLAGCGAEETVNTQNEEKDTITVYTTIYPLEDFTKKIGGSYVEVKSIYPPNVDAHSFEPSTKDMIALAESDLFIYTGAGIEGFAEKAVEALNNEKVEILQAAEGIELIEATDPDEHHHDGEDGHSEEEHHHDGEDGHSEEEHHHDGEEGHSEEEHHHDGEEGHSDAEHHEGESTHSEEEEEHDHGEVDPHVWLDPALSIELAGNIKDSLSELMPEHASKFDSNFNQLKAELEELDQEYKNTIEGSKTKYLLVSHAAYGYWEKRYGLIQIPISGLSPTQEPSQKELQEIITESTEHGIRYVIFEQNVSPKVAQIIQKEIGAESLTLHNLESLTEENIQQKEDYFSIMRDNLAAIKKALND
jgi:zinc transport system substrate-binding protein